MKNLENIKCEIEDMIGEEINNIFLHFQERYDITSGDCDFEHTYDIDRKTEELAKLIAEVLELQKGENA